MEKHIPVAVYYFPNYHVDERNEEIHGKNWTEWELMKCARSRFEGHDQPKIPLWGYEDEADPQVMAKKIDAASDAGIDAFIFDWYWYDGPYLERCLKEGFLKAPNKNKLKFALMWANHDWKNLHPGTRCTKSYPFDFLWTTRFETVPFVWDYLIENFFTQENYYRVDGKPYFSIYATNAFIARMGGMKKCKFVLDLLQKKAQDAGLPGIHLGGLWYDNMDGNSASVCPQAEWFTELGFSSYTNYIYHMPVYTAPAECFPRVDYDAVFEEYYSVRKLATDTLPGPYYPVVTVGWDSSPRSVQSEIYDRRLVYPYLPVIESTPAKFQEKIQEAFRFLKSRPEKDRYLFINAWNEWTEGSYIEPDMKNGYGYLEAVKAAREAENCL